MRVFAKTWHGRGIVTGLVLVFLCASPLIIVAAAPGQPAAGKGGITISPPLKEVVISSGLITANTDVGISNNTDQTLNATIKVVDFKALDEFGGVSLGQVGAPVSKYGLANWMTLPRGNSLILTKGQSTDIKIDIDNRADLTPGGHYGAVVVTASSPNSPTGNKINFKQELVSLLFLKKLGGEHYGLELKSIINSAGSSIPTSVATRFRSTGNVHVVPRGYVNVTDPAGKLVAKGIINTESTIILPGSERQLTTLLQPVADSSRAGKYKLTAYYRYDGRAQFSSKSIYFNHGKWSPRHAAILLGALLAIATAISWYLKHRSSKYKIKPKSRKKRFNR